MIAYTEFAQAYMLVEKSRKLQYKNNGVHCHPGHVRFSTDDLFSFVAVVYVTSRTSAGSKSRCDLGYFG